jgi:uncharacterized protein (DUF1697 family)
MKTNDFRHTGKLRDDIACASAGQSIESGDRAGQMSKQDKETTAMGRIVENNPFPDEAECDAAHLVVMFLKRAPSAEDIEALRETITGPENVSVEDKQAYIVYPRGIGRSRLTNTLLEKKLGTRGTARNWNTVLKLASVAED